MTSEGFDSEASNPQVKITTRNIKPDVTTVEVSGVGFNRAYFVSAQGLLRLMIIVFQFAQWVSAASVPKILNGEYYMIEEFYTTRSACLFFSILGFIVASGFYLTFLFNIHHQIEAIPWSLLLFGSDVLWALSTFSTAIACAVREGMIKDENIMLLTITNRGAFASASFFGFLLTFSYGASSILTYVQVNND